MDFCEEVAVLQCALQSAEKSSTSDLQVAVCVVCETIQEIVGGLDHVNTPLEQHHWTIKLVGLLLCRAYRGRCVVAGGDDQLEHLICGFPEVRPALLYETVRRAGMHRELLQVLHAIPDTEGRFVLSEWLSHHGDQVDNKLLLFLVENLILRQSLLHEPVEKQKCDGADKKHWSNKTNTGKESSAKQEGIDSEGLKDQNDIDSFLEIISVMKIPDKVATSTGKIVTQLLTCVQKCDFEKMDKSSQSLALLGLCNFMDCAVQKSHPVAPPSGFHERFTMLERLKKLSQNPAGLTAGQLCSLCDKVQDHYTVPPVYMQCNLDSNDINVDSITSTIASLPILSDDNVVSTLKAMCTTQESAISKTKEIPIHTLPHHTISAVLSQACLALGKTTTAPDTVVQRLAKLRREFMEFESSVCKAVDPGIQNELAIFLIHESPQQNQDKLLFLISHGDLESARCIECLQTHVEDASSPQLTRRLLTRLNEEQQNHQVAAHLRQLTLVSYMQLPLVDQNDILAEARREYSCETLFCVKESFVGVLTSTFNRLVHLTEEEVEQSAVEVSLLALQSPMQVLYKLVTDAVVNSGQQELFCKLLQCLPALCSPTSLGAEPPLCVLIRDAVSWGDLPDAQHRNLCSFINLLIQDGETPCLLGVLEFVRFCIQPFLSLESLDQASQVPLLTALDFLDVVVTDAHSSVQGTHKQDIPLLRDDQTTYPVLLCLVTILDGCTALYSTSPSMADSTKKKTQDIIKALTDPLAKVYTSDDDMRLVWLYARLQECSWPLQFYFNKLFSCSGLKFKMRVPENIASVLKTSEIAVAPFASKQDILEGLVEMSMASIDVRDQLLQSNVTSLPHIPYNAAVAGLAKALPQIIQGSDASLGMLLDWLLTAGVMDWPAFMPMYSNNIHTINGKGDAMRASLCRVQLLHDAVLVLSGCVKAAGLPDDLMLLAVRTAVPLLKNSGILPENAADTHEMMYVTLQTIYRLCHQMSALPTAASVHLFVLLMDLIGQYMDIVNKARDTEMWGSVKERMASDKQALTKCLQVCDISDRETFMKKFIIEE